MPTEPMDPMPASDHPYRAAPPPRRFDPDGARVPYDGQTRMRLTIASGLAHARIVIDPTARDLLAIEHAEGYRPRLHVADGELRLTWKRSFADWLRSAFTPRFADLTIVLHPGVAWSLAIRGGLSDVDLDLAAGSVERLEVSGGCSDLLVDLPEPAAIVPIRISGGASQLGVRRPAAFGVGLAVGGGLSGLVLDDQALRAIGGSAQLATGDVAPEVPHYALSISGGASTVTIGR